MRKGTFGDGSFLSHWDILGRFLFVPLGHSGTDLDKDRVQNVPKGQIRTVPKCPFLKFLKKIHNFYKFSKKIVYNIDRIKNGGIKMSEKKPEFKSGFVTIIGRTNVGKSTLINLLVGEKVAAIANKVQTTRTAIKGIVNRPNSQIVFTDTPGIHKPKHKLNETMIETSFTSLNDADVVLFLIEANSKEIGRGDARILEKIKEAKRKTILIINKIDLVKKEDLLQLIEIYRNEYPFEAVIPISALQEKYKDIILDEIEKHLKEGPAYYDIEEYTDQTLRQLAEETIREKALKLLQDEVPHGIYVEVEKMQTRKNKKGEEMYDIEATIYCIRESHKGIIIGKNGEMLKRIGKLARIDMEENFGLKVNLKTWVKVRENWLDNPSIVDKFKLK